MTSGHHSSFARLYGKSVDIHRGIVPTPKVYRQAPELAPEPKGNKQCARCLQFYPLAEFNRPNSKQLATSCTYCTNTANRMEKLLRG